MRIRSVVAALPSKKVTNDDIIRNIIAHSEGVYEGDLEAELQRVEYYLRYSGSESRQWMGDGERPVDLLRQAALTAMDRAEVLPGDIDLLIYTGIGRGFIEPGGAYHAAAAIGLGDAHCFDVIDACMSWTRAVQIVEALFKGGQYKSALIVNAECNLRSGSAVFPHLFRITSPDALESTFPAYTLGEAATATVLTADGDNDWKFRFVSRPDLAHLCNVTLEGYEGFCEPSDKLAKNGVGVFTSYGFEMHDAGTSEAHRVFEQLDINVNDVKCLFTHASSKRYWQGMADKVGLGSAIHHVYQRTGNVVSASVPVAMASAIDSGLLAPGDQAVGWVGSAGMSFGAFTFKF